MDLSEIDYDDGKRIELVRDRIQWRTFVMTAFKLRGLYESFC
jgi:hypothetical protein